MTASNRVDTLTAVPTVPTARGLRAAIEAHGLLIYTLLAFGVSWVLLIGGFFAVQGGLLGETDPILAIVIQVAAAGPLIAALVVTALSRGRTGLAVLGRGLARWRVNPAWYAFAFVGIPVTMFAAVSILYGAPLVTAIAENWPVLLTQLPVTLLGIAIFTGLAEEPGWRGFAQRWTNERYRPLVAALVVSTIWALWHLPNALFGQGAIETAAHIAATIVNGVVLAWVYNSTRGSLLLVMLVHGSQNATAGLVQALTGSADIAFSPIAYYVTSAVVFGFVMLVVAFATRGRLGAASAPPDPR
jgi:uncharacterized protein